MRPFPSLLQNSSMIWCSEASWSTAIVLRTRDYAWRSFHLGPPLCMPLEYTLRWETIMTCAQTSSATCLVLKRTNRKTWSIKELMFQCGSVAQYHCMETWCHVICFPQQQISQIKQYLLWHSRFGQVGHISGQSPSRVLHCRYCSRSFNSSSGKYQHERLHTGRGFVCDICSLTLSTAVNLRRHRTIHLAASDRPKFTCKTCGKSFFRADHKNTHERMCSAASDSLTKPP